LGGGRKVKLGDARSVRNVKALNTQTGPIHARVLKEDFPNVSKKKGKDTCAGSNEKRGKGEGKNEEERPFRTTEIPKSTKAGILG